MDEEQFMRDIQRQTEELEEFFQNDVLDIIETEGLNHFEESFDNEGFTDASFEAWDKRQTTDKRGRDITRYRTGRVGRPGDLNAYGRKNEGRAVLVGHDTGDKLKDSLQASQISDGVEFSSDKEYAQAHNEGLGDMPERKFIGESAVLNDKMIDKADRRLNEIFGK